jgi:deazaflavin-dependent oxidoreductase (nitroreductase family)
MSGTSRSRCGRVRSKSSAAHGDGVLRTVIRVLTRAFVAYVAFAGSLSLALRFGGPRVRDAVREFNKRILNPAMMKVAGRRHWYAAVVWHEGRRSGRPYGTPVVVTPVSDGFLIPLPYGEEVDWLRNLRAAGRATIEKQGRTYEVAEPEVLDASVALALLDARHRLTFRLSGIERHLRLRRVPTTVDHAA